MKKIVFFLVLIVATTTISSAIGHQTKPVQLNGLIGYYYKIKNALVAGDAASGSNEAALLIKNLPAIDSKGLTTKEQQLYHTLLPKITASAAMIAESKDINKQRNEFGILSGYFITLSKEIKLSEQTIYIDYCPMKKLSWISEEKQIKNPFYGNSMLSCGSVKDSIKQ